jgi:NAD(P)-dependent dehydrogenase (short-subunit alcohol dehydrogenase family)
VSSDRVAIVTGGGRGIGRGIAVALGTQDWRVVVNYRRNEQAAAETVSTILQSGDRALAVQADLADAADRERLVDVTLEQFGRVDLLVNNAGMAPRERNDILQMTEASYNEVMAVNLTGPFFLTQRVANQMIRLLETGVIEAPKIINIGSLSAYTSSPSRGEYCISKAGVSMITALFADRLAEHGINVYEVRPGIVETDMTASVKEKYDALIDGGLTPLKRWGQPGDVARAVLAIAEGYLPYSTGEVINVDGGFHLRRL